MSGYPYRCVRLPAAAVRPGRMAGDFILPHSIDIDANNIIYVAETGTGNRIQKFVPVK